MQIKIQFIHFSPSETLNQKIEKKLQKAFGKYPFIKKGNVFLKLQENEQKEKQIMEIRIALPNGELYAETREDNLYKALEKNMSKLKRQLEKYKEKLYAHP